MADRVAKGRGRNGTWDERGERNPNARLTAAQVATVKAMGLAGYHGTEIADQFGVTFSNVAMILRGVTWKDVAPGPPVAPVSRLSYRSKLSDDDAAAIRARYSGRRGELTNLANEYGVSRPSIKAILAGRTHR